LKIHGNKEISNQVIVPNKGNTAEKQKKKSCKVAEVPQKKKKKNFHQLLHEKLNFCNLKSHQTDPESAKSRQFCKSE